MAASILQVALTNRGLCLELDYQPDSSLLIKPSVIDALENESRIDPLDVRISDEFACLVSMICSGEREL